MGEQPNHTTARKAWPSINHSILSGPQLDGIIRNITTQFTFTWFSFSNSRRTNIIHLRLLPKLHLSPPHTYLLLTPISSSHLSPLSYIYLIQATSISAEQHLSFLSNAVSPLSYNINIFCATSISFRLHFYPLCYSYLFSTTFVSSVLNLYPATYIFISSELFHVCTIYGT